MSTLFVFVSGYNSIITCMVLDSATGELRPSSTSDGGKNPSYMAWHPNRKFMYAVNEGNGGRVCAFSINPKDGALTKIGDASSAGKGPCHVSVHQSGKWVFVANYGSGTIGVLPVGTDGKLGEPLEEMSPGKNAHMILPDSSGKYVFVPCLGSNHVAQFIFDEQTGKLSPNNPATIATATGAGPRHLAFHPSNRYAYLINELDSMMTSLRYDAAKGLLSDPQTLPTLPEGAIKKGNSTAHVLVGNSGRVVYGSNRGNNSIVIYGVDSDTGRLSLTGHETGGGAIKIPRNYTLDPSGKFMFVANQDAANVIVFAVDQANGTLRKLSTVTVPSGPSFVGVLELP